MLQWQTLGEIPAFTRSAALAGCLLYAIGPNKRDTVAFDLAGGGASPVPASNRHKPTATLAVVDDVLVLIGSKGIVSAYDPAQRSWSDAGTLRQPMFRTGVAAVGGVLYVVGGRVHSERGAAAMRQIERFDPATGRSETVGLLPHPASDCHVAVRADGVGIDILGGDWIEGASRLGEAEATVLAEWLRFDAVSHQLSQEGELPQPVSRGGAARDAHGRLYVVGGADRAVSVFDPAAGRWQSEHPLPSTGAYADAFVMDGRLIVSQSDSVHAATLDSSVSAPAPPVARPAGTGFVVVAGGEAGPFATREQAERVALELLRAGLSAEIRER